ncbi:MAG: mannose-1-phosphate guanylyltransferase, partial [Armatimonadota bacterium]
AGLHIGIDTRNCLILSPQDRLVATIGIQDMVVIDTEDAVLVCPRDRAQEVKKIVDKIKEAGLERYL